MTLPLDSSHSVEYLQDIENYRTLLIGKNLPVIYTLQHLCLLAGVNIDMIKECCSSNRSFYYKRFKLRKKRGGYRVIHTPKDQIRYLQKWILVNILNKVDSHNSCKGFDPNTSIKINAETHLHTEAVLKIDILRFYDTITEKRVFGIFKLLGYHPNLCVSLAKICTIVPDNFFLSSFKKGESNIKNLIVNNGLGILPQGSPTSPKLSNLVARHLDNRLEKLANKYSLNYSRYADDLTFSGDLDTLRKAKKNVYRILRQEKFYPNCKKTKILIRGNPYFVTGLSIHNNNVTIPKKRKKMIEHHLYHCIHSGVISHMEVAKITNRNFKDWLLGNIAFVYSVEKDIGQKYFDLFNKIAWPL